MLLLGYMLHIQGLLKSTTDCHQAQACHLRLSPLICICPLETTQTSSLHLSFIRICFIQVWLAHNLSGTHLLSFVFKEGIYPYFRPSLSSCITNLLWQLIFLQWVFKVEIGVGKALQTKELTWNKGLKPNARKMRNGMSRGQSNLFLSQKCIWKVEKA